jgi:hypothetical protein
MTEIAKGSELSMDIIASMVLNGDLSRLNQRQRVEYYMHRCRELGLDPAEKPFDLLRLNGKLVLYAKKGCTDALCRQRGVSRKVESAEMMGDLYVVRASATYKERCDEDIGAEPVAGLKGEKLANAMMKAVTKAKRRAVLALFGLGMLDETEVETIPGARVEPAPDVDEGTIELEPGAARVVTKKEIMGDLLRKVKRLRTEANEPAITWRKDLRAIRDGRAWPSDPAKATDEEYDEAIMGLEMIIKDLEAIISADELMPGHGGEEPEDDHLRGFEDEEDMPGMKF